MPISTNILQVMINMDQLTYTVRPKQFSRSHKSIEPNILFMKH